MHQFDVFGPLAPHLSSNLRQFRTGRAVQFDLPVVADSRRCEPDFISDGPECTTRSPSGQLTISGDNRDLPRLLCGLSRSRRGNHLRHFAYADRKSTRLNSSHVKNSYAVFCLKKKTKQKPNTIHLRIKLLDAKHAHDHKMN